MQPKEQNGRLKKALKRFSSKETCQVSLLTMSKDVKYMHTEECKHHFCPWNATAEKKRKKRTSESFRKQNVFRRMKGILHRTDILSTYSSDIVTSLIVPTCPFSISWGNLFQAMLYFHFKGARFSTFVKPNEKQGWGFRRRCARGYFRVGRESSEPFACDVSKSKETSVCGLVSSILFSPHPISCLHSLSHLHVPRIFFFFFFRLFPGYRVGTAWDAFVCLIRLRLQRQQDARGACVRVMKACWCVKRWSFSEKIDMKISGLMQNKKWKVTLLCAHTNTQTQVSAGGTINNRCFFFICG